MTQKRTKPAPPSRADAALRRLLKSSPQDLWLDTIRRANGVEHDPLVHWMVCQTQCDFAVAVHAFYRSNPGQHLDLPRPLPTKPGPSDIFAQVLVNWDTGFYRNHNLAVERQDVDPRQLVRINQKVMARARGSLPFNIPRRFLDPKGGTPAQLPLHLSPDDASHLWPLYAELGLRVPQSPPGIPRKLAQIKTLLHKVRLPSRAS
ncbi:MAG: hypothetical protein AAF801_08805 [Pseudomonadota bacterium]